MIGGFLMLGTRLKSLRNSRNLTQADLAKNLDVARTTYAMYEQNKREPDNKTLEIIANYFDVSTDYLLGRTDNPEPFNKKLPELTNKDEKDIAKDLENIINNISTDGYAHFDGRSMEDLDEDDKELLKASLENSMRLAKRLAKDKFTPKKYKKE